MFDEEKHWLANRELYLFTHNRDHTNPKLTTVCPIL